MNKLLFQYKLEYPKLLQVLLEYKYHILLAILACTCEYIFFQFGWVNHWWLGHFRYVWSQIPLHCFGLGLCMLLRRHGYWISFILCEIYILFILSAIFLMHELGNAWTELWLFIIKETTLPETCEFIIYYWKTLLPVVFSIFCLTALLFIYYLKLFKKKASTHFSSVSILGILFILPLSLWEASTLIRYREFLDISTPRIVYAFKNVRSGNLDLPLLKTQQHLDNVQITPEHVSGVLLIGESATRNHFSCYGYQRNTTPELSGRIKDCILFDNVWASQTYTQGALTYMLSTYECKPQQSFTYPLLLTTVFQFLGTHGRLAYYSSQHLWSNDSVMYQLLRGAQHSENGIQGSDAVLLDRLQGELSLLDKHTKHLVILQMMGSHFPYRQRILDEAILTRFQDDKHSALINEYDGTIFQTDRIIGTLIDSLSNTPTPTWLLYVSDHGETPSSPISRDPHYFDCWQVPFIFYFNSSFKQSFPDIIEKVENAKHCTFQSDIVFEIVCYLMGITWKDYKFSNVPFHNDYIPRPLYFPNGITPSK